MTKENDSPEQETPLTREEALHFLNTPSERNKQKAFLIYYGDERNEETNVSLRR